MHGETCKLTLYNIFAKIAHSFQMCKPKMTSSTMNMPEAVQSRCLAGVVFGGTTVFIHLQHALSLTLKGRPLVF